MYNELMHYGVKGMKWGVRKEYIPHPRKAAKKPKSSENNSQRVYERNKKIAKGLIAAGIGVAVGVAAYHGYKAVGRNYMDTVLKSGSKLNDLLSTKATSNDFRYLHRDQDRSKFRANAAIRNPGKSAYNHVYSLRDKVRIPSNKKAKDIFKRLVKEDQEFRKIVGSQSFKDFKNRMSTYDKFGVTKAELKKYYAALQANGYSGVRGKSAVHIFDSSKIVSDMIQEVSSSDLKKSFRKEVAIEAGQAAIPALLAGSGAALYKSNEKKKSKLVKHRAR